MAFKRVLVVDDSKLARVQLRKLLDEHDIDVIFAESGEEALELLDREQVDAIFMDHHMPGMDGLEAVAAIKRNPKTATIPVMMYTTRAGEVYVSQARALGAVGVLPKQVHPGLLFDMLVKLGLVQDRRAPPGEAAPAEVRAQAYDTDRRRDDGTMGITLQSVLRRILEDQHTALRADILRGNRTFARQVAAEILDEQRLAEEASAPRARRYSQTVVTALVLLLLVPALVLGGLYLGAVRERDSARAELAALERELSEQLQAAESVSRELLTDRRNQRQAVLSDHLEALTWSLNQAGPHAYDQMAFDDDRAGQLVALLEHLREVGFKGTVRLISHLGEFCLLADRFGALQPAPPDTPLEGCTVIGHPLEDSSFPGERQTPAFEAVLAGQANGNDGIRVEVVALDRLASRPLAAYPENAATAGEWNAVAARNHRVEFELIADPVRIGG